MHQLMLGRLLLVALVATSAWLAIGAGSVATTTAYVGVSETEWRITLGRARAPHGRIAFTITNYGQDDHNVAIRRNGVQYATTGRIPSGERRTLAVTLTRPGIYNVVCTLPGHRRLGMITQLTVF